MTKKTVGFESANDIAARLIANAPEQFGGPESLMVRWAVTVCARTSEDKGLAALRTRMKALLTAETSNGY
jgi:hypothetical protein